MTWPIDDPARMEADPLARWLDGRGLPGVSFVLWSPSLGRYASWDEADEADRRRVIEALAGEPAPNRSPLQV